MAAAVEPETAVEEVDWHAEVERCSQMYSIDQWMQPRSMVQVKLAKLKEETRCPMCFGKIRSARVSMVCLHRYCAKCIEQYLRAKVPGRHGDDKECPVCRAHLHSRRATKPDPMFDKIIKALYGDVDQYDAEEEVLIEEDNKAHVAAWQVQLADMKARQAAAVAAARAGSLPGAIGSQPAAAHSGSLLPTQAGPTTPVVAAAAAAVGGAASAGGLGRKRSWGDLQQQANGRDVKMARFAAGTFDGGSTAAGARSRAGLHQQQQQQGRIRHEDHEALLLASVARQRAGTGVNTAAGGAASRAVSHQAGKGIVLKGSSPTAELKSAGRSGAPSGGSSKKKKASARDMAAKLLGVAARAAAAAAPPRRCCLVHLQPANRQQSSSSSLKVAAGEARQGRGRKQPSQLAQQHAQRLQQQWQEGEQRYSAPDVDQPYLSCPLEVTVSSLKELLLQQLRQQGASDWGSSSLEDVQLLLAKPGGAAAASGGDGGAAAGVLGDGLTVGQLFEQWWGVGPELQVQYRLLVKA